MSPSVIINVILSGAAQTEGWVGRSFAQDMMSQHMTAVESEYHDRTDKSPNTDAMFRPLQILGRL